MNQIKRNKQIFIILLFSAIILGILLLLVTTTQLLYSGFFMLFWLYVITCMIGLSIFYNLKIKKPFKENIIPEILKKYKSSLEFIPKLNINDDYVDLIKEHKLIPSATRFVFTDGIIDEILGYRTTSFDLHATHTQSTGKSTTTITDFKGRFYDIEFDKLYCDFIIKEEILKRIPDGYEFLELELIDFNKEFNVYVTDKHEAFKIFTPSMIKNYYNLAGIDFDNTITHYKNGHLYIYIHNEENLFENMDDNFEEQLIEEYKKQYDNIVEYIKIFKCNI